MGRLPLVLLVVVLALTVVIRSHRPPQPFEPTPFAECAAGEPIAAEPTSVDSTRATEHERRERVEASILGFRPLAKQELSPFPSAPIAGIVRKADGTLVAGAELVVESPEPFRSTLGPLARTETDSQGRFELRSLGNGPFRVLATTRSPAHGPDAFVRGARSGRVTGQATLDGVFAGDEELELVILSCGVRGWVVDDRDAPISHFRIAWTPLVEGEPSSDDGTSQDVRNDSGEFSVTLSPGTWRASVAPKGEFTGRQIEVTVPMLDALEIVLARQGIVSGVVRGPSGEAITRATVNVPLPVKTEPDGSFRFGIEPGLETSLWAEHKDFAPSEPVLVTLEAGEVQGGIELRLGHTAHLSGRVLDPGGNPVEGRRVSFSWPLRMSVYHPDWGGERPVTDSDGRFAADLWPGRIHVSVELSDEELAMLGQVWQPGTSRPECTRLVTVGAGESADVTLAMGGAPVRLHGRLEIGGRPPAWADVRAKRIGGREWPIGSHAAGEYEVLLPGAGAYLLTLTAEDTHFQVDFDVPQVAEFRHDVSFPVSTITGHVRDALGTPIEGITLDAMGEGEGIVRGSARTRTDSGGRYTVEVVPGTYRVNPRTDFEEQRSFLDPESKDVEVLAGETRGDVDFELRTLGAIDGRLRVTPGEALLSGRVLARAAGGGHNYATTQTERFHLPLDAGRYWISAQASNGHSLFTTADAALVELTSGAVRSLELELVPCTRVRVRLTGDSDVFVELEAIDARGRSIRADKLHEDVRTLVLVPPGPYLLRARGERMLTRWLDLAGAGPELELEMAAQ